MAQITLPTTLLANTTARASDVMGDLQAITNVVNGQLGADNFTTMTAGLAWAITSTTQALTVTSTSTSGQATFTQSADLSAGNAIVRIVASTVQTLADAAVRIDSQSASSTSDVLKVTNSGTGTTAEIQGSGVLASGKAIAHISSAGLQTTGEAGLLVELTNASSTIPAIEAKHSGSGVLIQTKNAGSGAIEVHSDNSGNNLFSINSKGTIAYGGASNSDWITNVGVTYAAGLFSITGSDGTALSATNPAFITMPRFVAPNQGKTLSIKVTSGPSFQDHNGSSQISGNLFGTTTAVAWAMDVPFFLYAVLKSDETAVTFAISRNPRAKRVSGANNTKAGGTNATTDQSFFFIDSSITLSDYTAAGNAVRCIGSIRMQKNASNDWTVQPLSSSDGIGQFHEGTVFTMPTGQNGAASGKYFLDNGGTAPSFAGATQTYYYQISRSGQLTIIAYFNSTLATGASGAVNMILAIPMAIDTTIVSSANFSHVQIYALNSTYSYMTWGYTSSGLAASNSSQAGIQFNSFVASTTTVINANNVSFLVGAEN